MSYRYVMESPDKKQIARLVKEGRTAKGFTQQELADRMSITLRSVQRIENAEVFPRAYTLRLLEGQLGISLIARDKGTSDQKAPLHGGEPGTEPGRKPKWSRGRKWILTISLGLLLPLLTLAYIAQSARWPETDFEKLLLWSSILVIYSGILWKIWR